VIHIRPVVIDVIRSNARVVIDVIRNNTRVGVSVGIGIGFGLGVGNASVSINIGVGNVNARIGISHLGRQGLDGPPCAAAKPHSEQRR
jgi:hypothetical protein